MTSYERSFGSSSLRSCYWAIETASFVKSLLTILVDHTALDIRGWLFLDVDSCVLSEIEQQALIASFSTDHNLTEDVTVYDEDVSRVPNFLFLSSRMYYCYQGFATILPSSEVSPVYPVWFVLRKLIFWRKFTILLAYLR